jgi:hypothetical protein
MPRLPIDYANTIIYKIVCNDLSITECYVGHTTDFVRRKQSHKNRCANEKDKKYNLKIYKIILENGGWENFTMVVIELFPCNNSIKACKRERELYEELDCKMNTNFPQRDKKEYYIENKEKIAMANTEYRKKKEVKIAIKKKEWSKNNIEEIAMKQKEYYIANREQIILKAHIYYDSHKDEISQQQKSYQVSNKEKIIEYTKFYRLSNKEQIKERRSKLFVCECGKEINYDHKSRHLKTKIHNDLMLCKDVVL